MANDLLMWVGEDNYPTPEDFSSECITQGLSKRIAINNVPQGIEPGKSRLFLIHPKAGLAVDPPHTLAELREDLAKVPHERVETWLVDWERNPAWVVRQIMALKVPPALPFKARHDQVESILQATLILQRFGARLVPAIFGFVYLTGMQYVCKEGETDLPDGLQGKGIEPVRVVYDEPEAPQAPFQGEVTDA